MTDAQTILKLIETVDPADTAKLDEIDARVCYYYANMEYDHDLLKFPKHARAVPEYTRSRDALKAIRPEGWYWEGGFGYARMIGPHSDKSPYDRPEFYGTGRTEELAELHAIIQAIAYERGQ